MAGFEAADPARSRAAEFLPHAQARAREKPAGIGASVVDSNFGRGRYVWDCIVTDGSEWTYVSVAGVDVGPHPNLSAEDVEQGVERFAATLPATGRIRHLINASPLHIDRDGHVSD
ncbi:MAG TPA: hypothetical protein VG325_16465 [Solirubrobacteraceae bacterium]|jgi:hypothetical protein|nr:hypothetical protein [Solirubrobacteraceae bacterium]